MRTVSALGIDPDPLQHLIQFDFEIRKISNFGISKFREARKPLIFQSSLRASRASRSNLKRLSSGSPIPLEHEYLTLDAATTPFDFAVFPLDRNSTQTIAKRFALPVRSKIVGLPPSQMQGSVVAVLVYRGRSGRSGAAR